MLSHCLLIRVDIHIFKMTPRKITLKKYIRPVYYDKKGRIHILPSFYPSLFRGSSHIGQNFIEIGYVNHQNLQMSLPLCLKQ